MSDNSQVRYCAGCESLERELAEARGLLDSEIRARNKTHAALTQAESARDQALADSREAMFLLGDRMWCIEQMTAKYEEALAELEAVRKERDEWIRSRARWQQTANDATERLALLEGVARLPQTCYEHANNCCRDWCADCQGCEANRKKLAAALRKLGGAS